MTISRSASICTSEYTINFNLEGGSADQPNQSKSLRPALGASAALPDLCGHVDNYLTVPRRPHNVNDHLCCCQGPLVHSGLHTLRMLYFLCAHLLPVSCWKAALSQCACRCPMYFPHEGSGLHHHEELHPEVVHRWGQQACLGQRGLHCTGMALWRKPMKAFEKPDRSVEDMIELWGLTTGVDHNKCSRLLVVTWQRP